MERASGVLLHPTSFPGSFSVGDFGAEAYKFIDFLAEAGQKFWQILPLGPVGTDGCPYSSFSVFAGNHFLISPEGLAPGPDKMKLLRKSFKSFQRTGEFRNFCLNNKWWLDDYCLFTALKEKNRRISWQSWKNKIRDRDPVAIKSCRKLLSRKIIFHKYLQYQFERQWLALKAYANSRGIKIIGDLPIYCSYESADVWANPDIFYLDRDKKSVLVSGVPPDYFSKTGQLWGQPIYRWDRLREKNYDWWLSRVERLLFLVDVVRIDHFRALEDFWAVPFGAENAVKGEWLKGPGSHFLEILIGRFGKSAFIAEDLGIITREVEALRDKFNLPGMKVLQFTFDLNKENCVAYTGTHDNDTIHGWFEKLPLETKREVSRHLGREITEINWDLIDFVFRSKANLAIVPLQDILGLGSEARMNFPGKVIPENWSWRYLRGLLTDEIKIRLRRITEFSNRLTNQ